MLGSIDLLATNKDGTYTIFDWKNLKKLEMNGFNGKTGCIDATRSLQDSNFWHYALQLHIYEIILKVENYVSQDAFVKKSLNCFINGNFKQVDLPDVKKEAKALIKWYKTCYSK